MTTDTTQPQEPLPGLEIPEDDTAPTDALVAAVRRTLAALAADGLLEERHAAACQLALDLAASVTAGRRSRRASAVAMAARELREVLAGLPEPKEADPEADAWAALMDGFTAAGEGR